mmetsp:Transcript_65453/g.179580  ORF Transcript_65453/g.179580 Transcript_65453/m.179580 type:complete len:80 (-) Transcript_65453:870-1109(-)
MSCPRQVDEQASVERQRLQHNFSLTDACDPWNIAMNQHKDGRSSHNKPVRRLVFGSVTPGIASRQDHERSPMPPITGDR